MDIPGIDKSHLNGAIDNKNTEFDTRNVRQRPDRIEDIMEDGTVALLLQQGEKSCGSLDLGKHRNDDAPLLIEPEKHLSPRAPSKEFHFPKSK